MDICNINILINSSVNVLMLIFLLYLISKNEILSAVRTKAYMSTIIMVTTVIIAEMITIVLDGSTGLLRILHFASNIVGFCASFIAPLLLAVVYCEILSKKLKILLLPIIISIVLFLTTPFTDWMFTIDSDGFYRRGPLYFTYIATCIYSFSVLIYANFSQARFYQRNEKAYLAFLFAIIIAGSCIQFCFPKIYATWQAVTLSLVMYYIFQRELQFKYDSLTGALNRDAFEKRLIHLEGRKNTLIVFFDLNDFKVINDIYGHQTGDNCIRATASSITKSFRKIGNCYRVGGDEFCVLGEICDESLIRSCVDEMIFSMRAERSNLPILPEIAYGYSFYFIDDGKDIMYALNEADRMMYSCKKASKKDTIATTK